MNVKDHHEPMQIWGDPKYDIISIACQSSCQRHKNGTQFAWSLVAGLA